MRVKVHSPTPPPPGRRSQGRLTESAVIAHAQQLQCDIHIAGRLFNGLTANDRWHRIYRSQQRSLSLSIKG